MRAAAGDEVLVKGRHPGGRDRAGVTAGVHGADGAAPCLARWKSSDHQAEGGQHDREADRTVSLRA
jgi:Domain of unknown function (DUF1918)